MKTYKLGNKVKCIIRSCFAGEIGNQRMEYNNQPYTVLKDVEASLIFSSKEKSAKTKFVDLSYSFDDLQEVNLSNVEINDKILNLIFSKNEDKLCSTVINRVAEDNKIFIKAPGNKIYDVFVYDVDGNLEQHYDELSNFELTVARNEDYLIFFSYNGEVGFNLNRDNTPYLTLDLILTGNVDDNLNASFIHIGKCSLEINKNMYFNRTLNAVDLKFNVIDGKDNYITLK